MALKRQGMNYVANAARDLRKGINELETASRMESHENFILRLSALRNELDVMAEVVTAIEDQTELELRI